METISCLLLLIILFFLYIWENKVEYFDVTFGTPPDTSDDDKNSMKDLLEIGSQSDADKKYDVVSKSILGDINRPPLPNPNTEEPPDPKCFTNDIPFEYNITKLGNDGVRRGTISCCDKPDPLEINMDWNLFSESLEWEIDLDENELPTCCDD